MSLLNYNEYPVVKAEVKKTSVLDGRNSLTLPDLAFFIRRFELARGDVVDLRRYRE